MGFKIYTRTGDAGETGLYGGKRLSKDHIRIEAYGTVDELNSHIGLLVAHVGDSLPPVRRQLTQVQRELFTIGSQLATPPEAKLSVTPIDDAAIERLEQAIDALDTDLPDLTSFILPGGSVPVAQCHVCRTVTRRAERQVVSLHHVSPVDERVIRYLNRLSDYFFTASRALAVADGVEDVKWQPS